MVGKRWGSNVSAFDPDALWAKSRAFLIRGMRERDAGNFEMFHMWAALAMELLAKTALSSIHPSLIADPQHPRSLLAACGLGSEDNLRSISAKTTYERLGLVSARFDDRVKRICSGMAERRNAELHSGLSPVRHLRPQSWVPDYWQCAQIILGIQGKSLTDWAGPTEADSIERILADRTKVLAEAVLSRIATCREDFERQLPADEFEEKLFRRRASSARTLESMRLDSIFDGKIEHKCPACSSDGLLFGTEVSTELGDTEWDGDTHQQIVTVEYGSERFICDACGLSLSGQEELDIGDVLTEFETEEYRDVEYDEYQDE